jgi:hypothetical protein
MTKYKLSAVEEGSTQWDILWFDSEAKANEHKAHLLKRKPGTKVEIKGWEFADHEEIVTLETIQQVIRKSTWEFKIQKNKKGIFSVCVNDHHEFSRTFSSQEEAKEAVKTYVMGIL